MMKKSMVFLVLISLTVFSSCLNTDEDTPNFTYEYVAIDEAITPSSFTRGEIENITIKYTLPNSCYSFNKLYYDYQKTERIVAVIALKNLNAPCKQVLIQEEHTFKVEVTQMQDYVFKFWKGKDNQGKDRYEEVVIPVN